MGENPWNSNRESAQLHDAETEPVGKFGLIAVFGTNKVSTAKALQSLSNERQLKEHPFGGLLEIEKNKQKGIDQVTESHYNWIKPYKNLIEQITPRIDEALRTYENGPYNSCVESFRLFDKNELKEYKEMVGLYLKSHKKIELYLEAYRLLTGQIITKKIE